MTIPSIDDFGGDIREYKKNLRAQCKTLRSTMPPDVKRDKDKRIFEKIISTSAYKSADTVLAYVSTEIEVDTLMLIDRALLDNKRVAVPRCISGTRDMDFYFINSRDELERGSFGVLEPDPDKCTIAYDFERALCIIPGLAFDMEGYRLGYGKGYYDRFLSAHRGLYKMGICYCSCTANRLVHGRFDIGADMLVTEKYIRKTALPENTRKGR